jgi:tRNA pseudouridine38-40 synthase
MSAPTHRDDEAFQSPRNILLRLAYDGTDYYGWQIQPERPTIQGVLSSALEQLCNHPINLCGSGRTDAGVHAREQAANVRIHSPIPCSNLVHAMNKMLPEAIRVLSAHEVPLEFHARHDALSKTYCYRIFRNDICPPWLSRYVLPYPYPLDEAVIIEAAEYFVGTHDFTSLAASDDSDEEGAVAKSYVRTIVSSQFRREGEEFVYTVRGNGFLRHMVRNIVGTLIDIGRRRIPAESVPEIIAARNRAASGPTAPARGLHLMCVEYARASLYSVDGVSAT